MLYLGEWPPTNDWRHLTYKALTLILPVSILLTIVVMNAIGRAVPLYPVLFRMIEMKKRHIYCYNISLSTPAEAERVTRCIIWMLRLVVCVVFSFLWEVLILESQTVYAEAAKSRFCTRGWDCFSYRSSIFEFSPVDACDDDDIDDDVVALCYRVPPLLFTSVIKALAAGFAISGLILVSYECLVWMMLHDRTEREVFTKFCYGFVVITIFFWIFMMVHRSTHSATSWIGEATFLAVPALFYAASVTASCLRRQRKFAFRSERVFNADLST